MAFKGKKDKKVKKKKTKGKRDEEWTHEGGVRLAEGEAQEEGPKSRWRTQERDESFRRSRLKQDERKRKAADSNRMTKKIKFSDILEEDACGEGEGDSAAGSEDGEEEKPQREPNLMPITDRLQQLVNRSFSKEPEKKAKQTKKLVEVRQIEVEEDAEPEKDFEAAVQYGLSFQASSVDQHHVDDKDVDDVDAEVDEDAVSSEAGFDPMAWYFDYPHEQLTDVLKEKTPSVYTPTEELCSQVLPGTVQTFAHKDIPTALYQPARPWGTLAQVPGLHKMWRSSGQPLSAVAQTLLPKLMTYADVLIEGRNHTNDAALLEAMLMHGVFNVVKARSKVVKHNQRLKQKLQEQKLKAVEESDGKKRKKKAAAAAAEGQASAEDHNMRDQGFTRPRLLILTPFRHCAMHIVKTIIQILGPNTSVANMDRFERDFGPGDESDGDDDEDDHLLTARERKRKEKLRAKHGGRTKNADKPADWQHTFAGNMDDDFKLGIQLNPGHGKGQGGDKGAYLRIYSDFYISDILIASPLGLKLVINKDEKRVDHDFLSSIEQVVVHQLDCIMMQNVDHLEYVLSVCNQVPQHIRSETDYSRIRPYFLDKQAHRFRQLVMSTQFLHPELLSLQRRFAASHSGLVRFKEHVQDELRHICVPVKQVFQVVPVSVAQDWAGYMDKKFKYFVENVLAAILKKKESRVMIVAPSYFDYVRIRNYLMQQEASCVYVCEYSRESEIARGRAWFFHGVKDLLLYSGRMHFFRRLQIRGARTAIFYSLPEYSHFYPELVNMLSTQGHGHGESEEQEVEAQLRVGEAELSALVLTSKLEKLALQRVIGPKRADHMVRSDKSTFVFF